MTGLPLKQLTLFAGAIPALHAPELGVIVPVVTPTSPDTSLPWSGDYVLGGWSARMFLHQMLSTSLSAWLPSDTESLLSRSTLGTSQVRVAGGSSSSDALLGSPPDSSELYLTPAMVTGLARRAVARKRPLQRVLLRTPSGWLRRTLTVSSRNGVYVFSIPGRRRDSRDSPETGLLAWLEAAVEPSSETQ